LRKAESVPRSPFGSSPSRRSSTAILATRYPQSHEALCVPWLKPGQH
jgi:hypothetical protein